MKKIITALVLLTMLIVGYSAFAEGAEMSSSGVKAYVKGSVGFFSLQDSNNQFQVGGESYDIASVSSDPTVGYGGAVGTSLNDAVDLELEFSYRSADLDEYKGHGSLDTTLGAANIRSGDIDSTFDMKTLMVNSFYNFKNGTNFTPYVGAGFGIAWMSVDGAEGGTVDASDSSFAYSLMAGVGIELVDHLTFLAGYKYLGAGDFKYGQSAAGEINGNNVRIPGLGAFSVDSHAIDFGLKYTF